MRKCSAASRSAKARASVAARIIAAESDAQREEAAAKMGFSAYGVTQGDDPVAQAMKGLIDNAGGHEHQIALLWQAIEKLSQRSRELPNEDCVPGDAQKAEAFDAERLNRLVK
jgi:serine O-acetyltransferase